MSSGKKCKLTLIPMKLSNKNSNKIIDLTLYKNHSVLIKQLHVFFGKHDSKNKFRVCLNPSSGQKVLIKHKHR